MERRILTRVPLWSNNASSSRVIGARGTVLRTEVSAVMTASDVSSASDFALIEKTRKMTNSIAAMIPPKKPVLRTRTLSKKRYAATPAAAMMKNVSARYAQPLLDDLLTTEVTAFERNEPLSPFLSTNASSTKRVRAVHFFQTQSPP